ncbi:MAG: hypothetical protein AAF125_26205, partial [Chloroflexota bacterium]
MFDDIQRVDQFKTSSEAEAQGSFMAGWLSNQLNAYTVPKLEKYGITDIEAENWYPYQVFLSISEEIVTENDNMTEKLVAVGKAAAANIPLADFESMEAFKGFIESIHDIAVRNHPEFEGVLLRERGGEYYIINNTPNANDLFYGWLWQVLSQYTIGGERYALIPHADYPSFTVGSVFK